MTMKVGSGSARSSHIKMSKDKKSKVQQFWSRCALLP